MKHIDKNWSFVDAVEAALESYVGYGIQSKGYRNNYLKSWGSVVGRTRALNGIDEFIRVWGTVEKAAQALGVAPSTLKNLRRYYFDLPRNDQRNLEPLAVVMELDRPIALEEDRQCEFKEVASRNPIDTIKNTSDEYAVAFLNSEGGRILWGIRDVDRVVVGVKINAQGRDDLRKTVSNKLAAIRPHVDPASFRITFHSVCEVGIPVLDLFVVELTVPVVDPSKLHFTGGNEAFVRVDALC